MYSSLRPQHKSASSSSDIPRPKNKHQLLEDLAESRNLNEIEPAMREMDAFHNRHGTKRGMVGSPRIGLGNLIGNKL